MKLSVFLKMVGARKEELVLISAEEALEAVKNDGYALRYVKEQTENVCLEAVKRNGYALRYVDVKTFEIDIELEIK